MSDLRLRHPLLFRLSAPPLVSPKGGMRLGRERTMEKAMANPRRTARCPLLRLLRGDAGYSLIELIIVMMLLLVVIGALTDGFASATRAEADQSARASDQESAREALERMRKDIHCASGASTQQVLDPVTGAGTGNYVLNLTVTAGSCLGVTNLSSGVQWCTSAVSGSTSRYQLFRTTSGTCTSSNALFELDYITQANLWSLPTCQSGRFQTVAVDIPVNRNVTTSPQRTYDLQDAIALRNGLPCP